MERVYISGPITNISDYEEKFAKAEQELTNFGYSPVNPVKVGKILEKRSTRECKHEDYLKVDLQALLDCDGIYFLDGSENSEGCKLEKLVAEQCGIPTLQLRILNKKWL